MHSSTVMALNQIKQTASIQLMDKVNQTNKSSIDIMLKDFAQAQPNNPAPHPNLGKHLDVLI